MHSAPRSIAPCPTLPPLSHCPFLLTCREAKPKAILMKMGAYASQLTTIQVGCPGCLPSHLYPYQQGIDLLMLAVR